MKSIKELLEDLGYKVEVHGFGYNSAEIEVYDTEGKLIAKDIFGE